MNKDLLQKYIENKTSEEEKQRVLVWIDRSSKNQKEFNLLKAEHVAKALSDTSTNDSHKAYHRFKKRAQQKQQNNYLHYAAIVAIVVSTAFLIYKTQDRYQTTSGEENETQWLMVQSGHESNKSVTLPDGSVVELNIDSSIRYPAVFPKGERRVALLGEALFDIAHDSLNPFVVSTEDYDVKVLGTVFNVKSYRNDIRTETTLITGEVELLREKETPIILIPSQKAVFHKDKKKMKIAEVVAEDVIAWQKGSLVFNSAPMQQVALDLERKYHVEITINSPKLLIYEYTGTFDNLTLEESLQLLKFSSPITYEIEKNKIVINMKE